MHVVGTGKAKEAENLLSSFIILVYQMKKWCNLLKFIKSMHVFIWKRKFNALGKEIGTVNLNAGRTLRSKRRPI